MLETVSYDSQRESLDPVNSFLPCSCVYEDPWHIGDFRDPAAIGFLFELDLHVIPPAP